jgi:RNA polymerase sigma-70 factor (ECF subfamily)
LVPLTEQDTALWSGAAIGEAEQLLRQAGCAGRPGRYQLEAAVQSVYSSRIVGVPINWGAAVFLQEALQAGHPTVGGHVALAASVGLAQGARNGLKVLDALSHEVVHSYQPYWAVRGELLAALPEHRKQARDAYSRAIGLSTKPAERFWLITRSQLLDD